MKKSQIKLFAMDVDGTLTDGKIYMGTDGELMKAFNIKDGYGIKNLLPQINGGILPVIITGRTSNIVEQRCKELNIKYFFQGISNKAQQLNMLLCDLKLDYKNVMYIGDDDNDLDVMALIKNKGGLICTPKDASSSICRIADYICHVNGGCGAVREAIEWLTIK